ncbi:MULTISPECIES: cobalamin biosynthesis protein CobW [Cyanophyceae]|uniref:cobalamin biosynthesis protein CobW n=1 Tax=Cyanophyceae TaxID=3028117 RepID=UPI0016851604|nr:MULTISPECIES: cobalamin biosynthesis protein CobW [Cyanophyceae]MBD1917233.1 cobalamin biosynthesis protein CobW [Phormidium sp. FACHB-77]MBD2030764.1 cobalamin biosynthesis protein CobW [Phormidium sp. FACHB-322]MBD2050128.1 cobalamin biosynthesis protein CobW [Leptolyngbya sp. FACHB-60]
MHKIPVTIITGFLGAGKTTLIRQLLQNPEGRRIAVLVNEFGEVGIDGDLLRSCQVCDEDGEVIAPETNILELTNGCLCCTVQEEFLPTMQQLMTRRDQIDCIVIETSGLALPKPLVQAFRWPEIRTAATVDSVITLVDCEALAAGDLVGDLPALEAQRQADDSLDHETPLEELFEDQLNCADLVLLTKVDKVSEGDRTRIETWLTQQLPHSVKVLGLAGGEGSSPISTDLLLGFNAAVEDNLDSRPSHHDHEHDHDHDDDIVAIPIVLDQSFEPKALVKRLETLAATHEIYRIKGFVDVPNKAMRLVVHGVGQRFDSFFDRAWQPSEPRQTRLVVIGKDLDQEVIRAAIAA